MSEYALLFSEVQSLAFLADRDKKKDRKEENLVTYSVMIRRGFPQQRPYTSP